MKWIDAFLIIARILQLSADPQHGSPRVVSADILSLWIDTKILIHSYEIAIYMSFNYQSPQPISRQKCSGVLRTRGDHVYAIELPLWYLLELALTYLRFRIQYHELIFQHPSRFVYTSSMTALALLLCISVDVIQSCLFARRPCPPPRN